MATRKRRTVTFLRIVEEETFEDPEPASLPGLVVEAEEVPEPSRPPLARTAERWPWYRAAGDK
jgi:hypothetical protein